MTSNPETDMMFVRRKEYEMKKFNGWILSALLILILGVVINTTICRYEVMPFILGMYDAIFVLACIVMGSEDE